MLSFRLAIMLDCLSFVMVFNTSIFGMYQLLAGALLHDTSAKKMAACMGQATCRLAIA